jgi:high-affinity Fe2+/Pb2+ permease
MVEIATCTYSGSAAAAQAAGESVQPVIRFLIGIAVSIIIAYLIYRGAMRINLGNSSPSPGSY